MQVQWMEEPKSTVCPTDGPATASRQPERAVPQLWTCSGYKRSNLHIHSRIEEAIIPIANIFLILFDTMLVCTLTCVRWFPPLHPADHVSHLENVSEDEINRLLGMVVDVENLFMSVHKEEDTDTKQVYFYLFKVRRTRDQSVCAYCIHIYFSILSTVSVFLPFLFSPRLSAAEEMHSADESASSGGISRKSTF